MENFIINITTNMTIHQILPYFLIELVCIIGVIINAFIALLDIKKLILNKASNIITAMVFLINSILAVFLFFIDDFPIEQNIVVLNNSSIFLKVFVNIYGLFFLLATYNYTKYKKRRLPIVNMIFILIIMLSGLIVACDNFAIIYLLFEGIAILIYKYVSNLDYKENMMYSPIYVGISFLATFLFVVFYFMDYLAIDFLQKGIIQSCMVLAILLKIGLFPIFNYSMDKKCLSNAPYAMLLYGVLPFSGSFVFNEISSFCMFNEIYQLSVMVFLILCAIMALIPVFKTKSLTFYFVNLAQIYICFYMLNIMYNKESDFAFLIVYLIAFLAIYYMADKYKNKRIYTLLFSVLLIFSALLIPLFGHNILFSIYTFDKLGFYILNTFIFCNVLIIIKTLNIIESFYKTK